MKPDFAYFFCNVNILTANIAFTVNYDNQKVIQFEIPLLKNICKYS